MVYLHTTTRAHKFILTSQQENEKVLDKVQHHKKAGKQQGAPLDVAQLDHAAEHRGSRHACKGVDAEHKAHLLRQPTFRCLHVLCCASQL